MLSPLAPLLRLRLLLHGHGALRHAQWPQPVLPATILGGATAAYPDAGAKHFPVQSCCRQRRRRQRQRHHRHGCSRYRSCLL